MIGLSLSISRALAERGAGSVTISDPLWASVIALLHMDGTDGSTIFTDESSNTWTAFGNAQIDTSQSMFGGASLLGDGAGDWLASIVDTRFNLPGDFTIEWWCRPANITGLKYVFDGITNTSGDRPGFYINGSGFDILISGTAIVSVASGAFTANAWHHVACTRAGTAVKVFINGNQVGTTGNSATALTADRLRIGNNVGNNFSFNGHIDEFRITKGVARYTAAFIPPVGAFPNN